MITVENDYEPIIYEQPFSSHFYGNLNDQQPKAFMSKIFRPVILKKHAITYLDDVFMQSPTKDEMFIILEQYHQILKN